MLSASFITFHLHHFEKDLATTMPHIEKGIRGKLILSMSNGAYLHDMLRNARHIRSVWITSLIIPVEWAIQDFLPTAAFVDNEREKNVTHPEKKNHIN